MKTTRTNREVETHSNNNLSVAEASDPARRARVPRVKKGLGYRKYVSPKGQVTWERDDPNFGEPIKAKIPMKKAKTK